MTIYESNHQENERITTVFFSYSRDDQKRAMPFIKALEEAGYRVWWDGVIEGGTRYIETTEEALESASAVVVLWSKTSINSHWVQDEAMLGRERNCLIPLSIDGVEPPLGFRQFQVIDVSKSYGHQGDPEIINMIRATATLHNRQQPDLSPPPTPLLHSMRRRRLLLGSAGAVITLLGGYGVTQILPSSGRKLAKNGVVVLPFDNISGREDQDYLSAGLSAEIRSSLALNDALRVVAQSSSEALKDRALDAISIARELGVSFLLDGTVRMSNNLISVSAELIDGKTGFSRWSEKYERPMDDLLLVERDIASAVTSALSIEVSEIAGREKIGAATNAAAFNEFLKGKTLFRASASTEIDLQALAHFDAAIELDSDFAAAHSARARTLTVLGNTSDTVTKAQLYYESAEQAATRAVELGPDMADTHSALGLVLFQARLKIKEARAPYERSRVLGNGFATVLARYANYSAATGRSEVALTAIERARSLDPLNPNIHRAVGFVYYAAGRFERSIDAVEKALVLNEKLSDSHARIGRALMYLGRPEQALIACKKESSRLARYPCLAALHFKLGNRESADAAMADLIEVYGDGGMYQQAQILAQWGELDRAMEALQTARSLGDSGLTYLRMDPMLNPLRERHDFSNLLMQLGFD